MVIGPTDLNLASFTTSSAAAYVDLSTGYTRPPRGASIARALGFSGLCLTAQVLPHPVCQPALQSLQLSPPRITAFAFTECDEHHSGHQYEERREKRPRLRQEVAPSTQSAIAARPSITT